MKRLNLTIILCIIIGLHYLYSQKIKDPKPEKVTIADFSTSGNKSICLWYSSVFSFPYYYSEKSSGARDYLFSLKNETYMRILLNRNDTSFAINKFYNSIPELETIDCYYLNENIIISVPVKETDSVLITNYFDKGCFLNFSSLIDTARNMIVDLKYTYPIFSKKEINFYIDRNLEYKFLYIRMDVPEIYKYKINFVDSSFTMEISKPHAGPILGYGPPQGMIFENFHFMSKNSWEKNFIHPPSIAPDGKVLSFPKRLPPPYYCMINSYIFRSKTSFVFESVRSEDNYSAVIKLGLNQINEILH